MLNFSPADSMLGTLIKSTAGEIKRRDPTFIAQHDIVPSADEIERAFCRWDSPAPAFAKREYRDAAALCTTALESEIGITAEVERPSCPLVTTELAASVADAIAVQLGAVLLSPGADIVPERFDSAFAAHYELAATRGDQRCFVRHHQGRPLILINALGIPLRIWSSFLLDAHSYQLVIPELACAELFAGGMRTPQSASEHASAIVALLDAAGIDSFDVLSWCNGGRVAAELVRLYGTRVGKLVLVSPTFRGADPNLGTPSAYENKLEQVFATVRRNPSTATYVCTMLAQLNITPDWIHLPADPAIRAQTLFGLPDRVRASDLTAPMSSVEQLCLYAARTASDEAISSQALHLPAALEVHLICGDCDAVVSNAHTQAYLRTVVPTLQVHTVSGAGHYMHDLQYPYFRWLIDRIIGGQTGGRCPLRIHSSLYSL